MIVRGYRLGIWVEAAFLLETMAEIDPTICAEPISPQWRSVEHVGIPLKRMVIDEHPTGSLITTVVPMTVTTLMNIPSQWQYHRLLQK